MNGLSNRFFFFFFFFFFFKSVHVVGLCRGWIRSQARWGLESAPLARELSRPISREIHVPSAIWDFRTTISPSPPIETRERSPGSREI